MRFADKELQEFWVDPSSCRSKRIPGDIRKTLFRKLQMIDAACEVRDLLVPPGNRLEALRGDRAGQFSIRVNAQWRICFVWADGEAREVEFCDYHS